MEQLIKIVKISSKSSFNILKKNAPYFCTILDKNIFVTNKFYKHISWYSRNRKIEEIIERLSIISLIEEIALSWNIFQTKEDTFYEKMHFIKTYKLSYKIEDIYFIILVWEKDSWKLILLSCFAKTEQIKKDQFVLRTSST